MALVARRLGTSDVQLSPITFGSMRIHERLLDDQSWDHLIRASLEAGITTFHSSTEYESFPRFCDLLRKLSGSRLLTQHIVKLADPHFGEFSFDPVRFESRVEAYLTALESERIDVVQWMWRGDLKHEPQRLDGLRRQCDEIAGTFEKLIRAGKLGAVAPFPYTEGFADLCLSERVGHGLTVYWNPAEIEMRSQIERAARAQLGIIAIRPFAAGKALNEKRSPRACLDWVLATPGVTTAIVSYSSIAHLRELTTP